MSTCVNGECDKSCSLHSSLLILIFICIAVVFISHNETMRSLALFVACILLVYMAVSYEGGYEQFTYFPSEKEKIMLDRVTDTVRKKMKDYIPEKQLNLPVKCSNESYTYQKRKIYLCVKDTDYNTLMYVYLHELAHSITTPKEKDPHGKEWKKNFEMLLNHAVNSVNILDRTEAEANITQYMSVCSGKGKHRG